MSRLRILIADDDADVRFGIREFLRHRGYEVEEVDSCAAALDAFTSRKLDAAILDYSMRDGNSIELLPRLRAAAPRVPIIILTGYGTAENELQAISEGADEFLTKPTELQALAALIERVIAERRAG